MTEREPRFRLRTLGDLAPRTGRLEVDLWAYDRALEEGDHERAVELYDGGFLEGFNGDVSRELLIHALVGDGHGEGSAPSRTPAGMPYAATATPPGSPDDPTTSTRWTSLPTAGFCCTAPASKHGRESATTSTPAS